MKKMNKIHLGSPYWFQELPLYLFKIKQIKFSGIFLPYDHSKKKLKLSIQYSFDNIRVIIETDMKTFQCFNTLNDFAKVEKLVLVHKAKI